MKPLTIINFKTYKSGQQALKLAKSIQKVSSKIIIGVQPTDITPISKKTKLQVFAQHVDCLEPGRYTGFITPQSVKKAGAVGTFLNHSEHPLPIRILEETIKLCKKTKLKTAVFTSNLAVAKKIEAFKPDYLIYEPPELVAGNKSVSKTKPHLIIDMSRKLKTKFLVGAGIKNKEDVKKALELGAFGIAVSSAITKSKNPRKALKELVI